MISITTNQDQPGRKTAELQRLLDASPDVHYVARASTHYPISFISAGIKPLAGYEPSQFTNNTEFWANHIHPDDRNRVFSDLEKLCEIGGRHVHEYRFKFADEAWHWIHDEFCLVADKRDEFPRIVGTWLYTHGRRNAGTLRALENTVVTLVASETPLEQVLDVLNQGIEARFPEMFCSALLLDDSGSHLAHGSAPSLPRSYVRAIDGIAIGPDVGSCGTAAFLKKPVIVSDIASDPLWQNYRDVALEHGLRACWSTPIIGAGGSVLGSFAIYYKTPRRPTAGTLEMLNRMASLVAVAIEHRRTQERARETRLQLQAFMDHSPDLVFIKDTEGRFVLVNKAFEEVLGIDACDFAGRTVRELYSKADADLITEHDRVVVDEKRAVAHECRLSRPNKDYIFETTKFPILDSSGQVLAIGGIDHDITKLKRTEEALRQSEQQLRLVTDNLPILIAYCDANCRYRFANSTCETWFVRPREQIIGKTVIEVLGEATFNELRPYIEKALEGHRQAHDARITYPDGNIRDIHRVYIPHLDREEKVLGFYAMVLDITSRKKAEDSLRHAHEHLEACVAIRTAEIQRTNDRLIKEIRERKHTEANLKTAMVEAQEASRTKDRFLASMSHELRTPLNAIIGYSELLKEESDTTSSARNDVGRIYASARHLLRLIDDVITLSQTESGHVRMEIQSVDLSETVRYVSDDVRPLMTKNGNNFMVHCADSIGSLYADETKVRRCLLNLLENAAKFTELGNVEFTAVRETIGVREWATFRVKDNGVGISPEKVQTIFDPFVQEDGSTTRKYGGAGLGLSVTLRFCELMGGRIEVESEPGKGSLFTLRLPFDGAHRTPAP